MEDWSFPPLKISRVAFFLDRSAEHLVMPFEVLHVIGGLQKASKYVQEGGGILRLWVEGIEEWTLQLS